MYKDHNLELLLVESLITNWNQLEMGFPDNDQCNLSVLLFPISHFSH